MMRVGRFANYIKTVTRTVHSAARASVAGDGESGSGRRNERIPDVPSDVAETAMHYRVMPTGAALLIIRKIANQATRLCAGDTLHQRVAMAVIAGNRDCRYAHRHTVGKFCNSSLSGEMDLWAYLVHRTPITYRRKKKAC